MLSWPVHDAVGLEAGEDERLHELLQRHAVLQAQRDGDGKAVHQRAEGSAFPMHVDEDLAQAAVSVFARAQVDLVTAHLRLLGVATATGRQGARFAQR